jgi:aminopeptidase N
MKKLVLTLNTLLFVFIALGQAADMEALLKSERNHSASLRNYDARSMSSNNFDVHFYRCIWNVNPAVRQIAGSVTSYFTITSATNNITFDLANALIVDSIVFRGTQIAFVRNLDALQVNFPQTLTVNQRDSVKIFYRGTPPPSSEGYFVTSSHSGTPVLWTLSQPYGARTWWPCKDVLRDKPDSIDIIITNPSAYVSSSNGLPVSETVNGGNRTTFWKHRYPIAAYLVAIAVTNYTIENDAVQLGSRNLPVSLYAYPESINGFRVITNTAKSCLQGFSTLFGEYPFINERYAQTQFSVGGGMEHQTNSFMGGTSAGLVAHELGHQWFGDKVTCASWSDLWLNEGWASYLEYVYVELANPANRLGFLQGWRNNITSSAGGSVYVYNNDTLNVGRLFNYRLTYLKGGYVLHMLRWKLGDSTFFRGSRRYVNDPQLAYRTAFTQDFQRIMETESGQNLTEFLNDWIYKEGYPNYDGEWSRESNNAVRVRLNQTPSHSSVNFFEMPVPLQFRNATRDTIVRVEHISNGQVFNINLGFVPDTMIIDPQLWILSRIKTTKRVESLTPQPPANFNVYPNPVLGTLNITLPQITNGSVQIFNSIGQQVYSSNTTTNTLQINTWKWASGVYWIRVEGTNFRETRKITIVNR